MKVSKDFYILKKGVILMDWVKISYASILLLIGVFIFFAPFRKKSDERKEFIQTKAQSYAFVVLMGMLILDVGKSLFLLFTSDASYTLINPPIVLLTIISIIYLVTYLTYKNKYGG